MFLLLLALSAFAAYRVDQLLGAELAQHMTAIEQRMRPADHVLSTYLDI
jgi:hypothetical protein